jgi:hypothetical protein
MRQRDTRSQGLDRKGGRDTQKGRKRDATEETEELLEKGAVTLEQTPEGLNKCPARVPHPSLVWGGGRPWNKGD